MTQRTDVLQSFIDAALDAFEQSALAPEARRTIAGISNALKTPGSASAGPAGRMPACQQLGGALALTTENPVLLRLVERFLAIEPQLLWDLKTNYGPTASPNFDEEHANTMIIGPGGLEERQDLWLGATLMAPHVRYPDHTHPPEEVYLVLTPGEFRQGEGAWFNPGVGGSLYNPPRIRHAMRAVDAPFFAFWALLAET